MSAEREAHRCRAAVRGAVWTRKQTQIPATAAQAPAPRVGTSRTSHPFPSGGLGITATRPAGVMTLSFHSSQPRRAYLRSDPGSGSTGSAAERWATSDPGSPLPRPDCAPQPPLTPGSRARTTAPPCSRKRQKRAPPIMHRFPHEVRMRLVGNSARSLSAPEEWRRQQKDSEQDGTGWNHTWMSSLSAHA